jgi:hypothetical protein
MMDEEGMDLFGEGKKPGKPPMGKGMPPPSPTEPMGDAAPDFENLFKDKLGKGGDYEPPNESPEHEASESAITEALEVGLGREISPEQAAQIAAILNGKGAPTPPVMPAGAEKLRGLNKAGPAPTTPMAPPV